MPVPPGLERSSGIAPRALLLALASTVPQFAQTTKTPPQVDPYTEGEPARLAELGYRSFGPFRFGATTNELVQARLGDVPILWAETEHFRLGSALEEYKPESREELEELARELDELRARGRDSFAKAKVRKLDPWLRLHLFAGRLERLHADFCARLGVLARPGPEGTPALAGDKTAVLLTAKTSTLERFAREFCGQARGDMLFHRFTEPPASFFGLSDESVLLTDSELHYALVYGVTQSLLYDINGFTHDLPSWWMVGAALWFARAAQPRVLLFSRPGGELLPPEELADWQPLVRARVAAQACIGWREMLDRKSWLDQPFGDNVVLWSRIDYLMRPVGEVSGLVRALHAPDPVTPDGEWALRRATGVELAALDAAWCEWVTTTYRKKRR